MWCDAIQAEVSQQMHIYTLSAVLSTALRVLLFTKWKGTIIIIQVHTINLSAASSQIIWYSTKVIIWKKFHICYHALFKAGWREQYSQYGFGVRSVCKIFCASSTRWGWDSHVQNQCCMPANDGYLQKRDQIKPFSQPHHISMFERLEKVLLWDSHFRQPGSVLLLY